MEGTRLRGDPFALAVIESGQGVFRIWRNGGIKELALKKDGFQPAMKNSLIRHRHGFLGRSKNILLLGQALIFCGLAGMLLLVAGAVFAQDGKPPKQPQEEADVQRLAGRWVRPDGGYLLEIQGVHKDGRLDAAYFNPQPINVFQAVWARQGGNIKVMVELRDVNYPGSTYQLEYLPESDRLVGSYFQAVERQTYDVYFTRAE